MQPRLHTNTTPYLCAKISKSGKYTLEAKEEEERKNQLNQLTPSATDVASCSELLDTGGVRGGGGDETRFSERPESLRLVPQKKETKGDFWFNIWL